MRIALAALLIFALPASALTRGTSGQDGSFAFAFGSEPQNRIGYRQTDRFTGVENENMIWWGDADTTLATDTGWLHKARYVTQSELTYPGKVKFSLILGDVVANGGERWRDFLNDNVSTHYGCNTVAEGYFWEGRCQDALDLGYERMGAVYAPHINSGMCVMAVNGNHDTDCSGDKSKNVGTSEANDCNNGLEASDEAGYIHWLSMPPHSFGERSCPNYDSDYSASANDRYGVTGHQGSGLGLNQTAVLTVGDESGPNSLRILGINFEPSASEWTWITNLLDNDPPGLPTIVFTHAAVDGNGDSLATSLMNGSGATTMQTVVDALRDDYPNVFLILGGHFHDQAASSIDGGDLTLYSDSIAHTGVGETQYSLGRFTCNMQDVYQGSLGVCYVRVDPDVNEWCWEVVVPSWEHDPKNSGFQYEGPLLSDSVGASKRLDLITAADTRGCHPLDWTGW